MDVFNLDAALIGRYEAFARSFTEIRAADLKAQIDAEYASERFWPEALIGLNPNYQRGIGVADLVRRGDVDPALEAVFATGDTRSPITLHRHQEQAVAKAQQGRNYIVTTGTGSGKSLAFFVPIIDRVLRGRRAGEAPRTRAVVIYPMNALANSQRDELEKFVEYSGLPPELKPTYARFTGQEKNPERSAVAGNPPDRAEFDLHGQIIKRSQGRSAVNAAVYRAGEVLYDKRLDRTFDYTRKQGVEESIILGLDHAPEWMFDREMLWNTVEDAERHKAAQVAREFDIGLPIVSSENPQSG